MLKKYFMVIKYTIFTLPFFFASVFAQDAHKCKTLNGYVYQDSPCREDVRVTGGSRTPAPTDASGPMEIGKEICRIAAPKAVGWKDPESIRIGMIFGGKTEVIRIGESPVGARLFYVNVNAKNSYGGYGGEKALLCYTSEDGRRVIKIDSSLFSN